MAREFRSPLRRWPSGTAIVFAAALVGIGFLLGDARGQDFADTLSAASLFGAAVPESPVQTPAAPPAMFSGAEVIDVGTIPAVESGVHSGSSEDAMVTANVRDAITAILGSRASRINVETRVAVVFLSGEAATPGIRDRAREAAWIVSGVASVVDRIVVKPSA